MKMENIVAGQNQGARSRSFWSLLPWAVLAIGMPASVLLSEVVQDSVERVARLRFEREANDANGIIEGRLRSYADVMYALRALFSTEAHVDRLKFQRFVESLDLVHRYPGFDSLNYAAYVRGKDKKAFEESVRRDTSLDPRGYPGFAIKPAGERPEYYVVVYLEPMQGYEFAFGLDIAMNPAASNPERIHLALNAGRDSGKLTASGQPLRIKQARESIYLAMRLAIYRIGTPIATVEQRRAAYLGSVGAGFNLENLMRGVLTEGDSGSEVGGMVSADMLRYVRVRLYDVGQSGGGAASAPESRRLLFDSYQLRGPSSPEPAARDPGAEFRHAVAVVIGDRTWDFEYSAERNAVISRLDRILRWWVLAGGVLFSLLLFGVLYALASSRGRAVAMANEITRDLRESREQLQALSRRLVEVQELERRRLSSELHDRVGQNLTALSINLDILKTRVAAGADEEVASRLDDSQHLLGATADTIDNVMAELRPPMLDDYGLHAALNWHARDFSRRTGVDVITVPGDEGGARPRPEIEITLFRIAQEALNNVAKHAQAEQVTIALEFPPGECIMSVADDGKGFETAKSGMNHRQGVGMVTMRERAQAVGGSFEVRSAPGSGTQIIVRIPR